MNNPIQEHKDNKEPYIHVYVKNDKFNLEYQGTSEDMSHMIGVVVSDTIKHYYGDKVMSALALYNNINRRLGITQEELVKAAEKMKELKEAKEKELQEEISEKARKEDDNRE